MKMIFALVTLLPGAGISPSIELTITHLYANICISLLVIVGA